MITWLLIAALELVKNTFLESWDVHVGHLSDMLQSLHILVCILNKQQHHSLFIQPIHHSLPTDACPKSLAHGDTHCLLPLTSHHGQLLLFILVAPVTVHLEGGNWSEYTGKGYYYFLFRSAEAFKPFKSEERGNTMKEGYSRCY